MDRFVLMTSFVAVVKEQSFANAGRTLGISRSLVSRHIAELESQLGTRLLNRTTRSINLTESGSRYFEFSRRILGEISEEEAAIGGLRDKAEGELSIISPKWIGVLDLGDAIASFASHQPKIRVRLELGGMTSRPHGFIEDGYDIAFHTNDLRDSSIKVRKIATLEFALCASPEYLEQYGEPQTPADLSGHKFLIHTNNPNWHLNQEGSRAQHFKPTEIAFSSNTYLILQKAALRGMGIAVLPIQTVASEVIAGRLKVLMPDYTVPSRPLYAAFSPGNFMVKKVRLFIDFMAEWFRTHPMERARSAEGLTGQATESGTETAEPEVNEAGSA